MIEKLVNILSFAELDLEAEDIADALWLASYLDQPDITARITAPLPKETQPHFSDASRDVSDARQQIAGKTKPPPTNNATVGSQAFLPSSQQRGKTTGGMAFRSPTASALPGSLGIARALHPFKRGTPSNNQFILDEDATAERIAELGIWLPAFKPAMTSWFEIALVIDESASMVIWQQTIAELRFLLEHHGAFRDVRTWKLLTGADSGKVEIATGTGFDIQKRQIRSPGELLDPLGRRLILVVTDCVSPPWRNGEAIHILTSWAEKTPVVIAQVLPQRLWSQTALGVATPVRLHTSSLGPPNTRLSAKITNHWIEGATLTEIPMPVITLEAKAFSAWSRMLTGMTEIAVPGFLLEKNIVSAKEEHKRSAHILQKKSPSRLLSPEERLRHFQATASPLSRKLAQLLAAAPISLPVIRLIQHIMVPEASQIHIAEFFLSGLLEELPSEEVPTHPDDVQYEFIDGIRDILLNSISMSDSIQVLKEVSDFISDKFGQPFDFNALLTHPQGIAQVHLHEKSKPFAIITAKVLHKFGGKYAELAEEIERTTNAQAVDTQQANPAQQKPPKPEQKMPVRQSVRRSSIFNNPRTGLYVKRTCPSCSNAFYPGDCAIMSERSSGKILKQAPTGWRQQIARINPEPLMGQRYMLELARRQCPHCGYLLPYNIERVNNVSIAVVGDTFSGKSHYLASLIQQIRTEWMINASGYVRFVCLTDDVEQTYIKDYFDPLFIHRQALAMTHMATSPYPHPLIYNLTMAPSAKQPARSINLILYDVSGEDYANPERLAAFSRHVLNASAIIFLIDPIALPGIFKMLPSFLQEEHRTTGRASVNIFNSIVQLFERATSVSELLFPIAMTVSKSDLLKYIRSVSQAYQFLRQPKYDDNGLNLQDLAMVNQEVSTLLEEYGEYALLQVAHSQSSVQFFAVSATGSSPDASGLYPAVEPIRCLDPFLWCLYQLGIIDAKE